MNANPMEEQIGRLVGTLLAGGGKVLVSLPQDFKGTSYTVPDGVETISDFLFYKFTTFTSVTLPASLMMIGTAAFQGCTKLTSIALPDGYAGFVQPRSGLAIKQGLSIVNTPGLIDAHYRGELKVILINLAPTNNIQIKKGDRIAQLVIQEVPTVNLIEVEELDETDRGKGGFGSSGIA